MKKLLLLFAFFPLISLSQEYSEVVEVPGKTAEQLYGSAREWFAKSFISADNALLMDDRVSGKIIAKGSILIVESFGSSDRYANFTIKVSFKDGRYKTEITDISVTNEAPEGSPVTTTPFKTYLDKKEYYKNNSDPDWIINNAPAGVKIGKLAAKAAAQPNQATYNLICKIESEMQDLLSKLQAEIKKSEDDW